MLGHQLRIDTEDEIISFIIEKTNDPENITHRIANRNDSYCKNKTCKCHEIRDEQL